MPSFHWGTRRSASIGPPLVTRELDQLPASLQVLRTLVQRLQELPELPAPIHVAQPTALLQPRRCPHTVVRPALVDKRLGRFLPQKRTSQPLSQGTIAVRIGPRATRPRTGRLMPITPTRPPPTKEQPTKCSILVGLPFSCSLRKRNILRYAPNCGVRQELGRVGRVNGGTATGIGQAGAGTAPAWPYRLPPYFRTPTRPFRTWNVQLPHCPMPVSSFGLKRKNAVKWSLSVKVAMNI